jgi:hypothetical protein
LLLSAKLNGFIRSFSGWPAIDQSVSKVMLEAWRDRWAAHV